MTHLGPGFPDRAVWEAYMEPEVEKSEEVFEWGNPDLDLLRRYEIFGCTYLSHYS